MKKYFLNQLVILVLGLTTKTFASDYHSPRTLALGGAGHAGPLLTDGIYLNPAFIPFVPTYTLSFSYLKYSAHGLKGRNYNISIQDGRTELFQAGFGYTSRTQGALFHVAAAKAFWNRSSIGVGGKFFLSENHTPARDVTFGFVTSPDDWLQLSFITDNIIETTAGKKQGFYREFIIGSKINVLNIVLAYFDPHLAPTYGEGKSFGHEAGLEFAVMTDLFLRAGHFRNANIPHQKGIRGDGMGLGIGWAGPRISLDYGFSKVFQSADLFPTTTHALGASIFF